MVSGQLCVEATPFAHPCGRGRSMTATGPRLPQSGRHVWVRLLGSTGRVCASQEVAGAAESDPKPPCRDPLFDHLIGGDQQDWRQWQAKCFCGLEVDAKFEPGHLLEQNDSRLPPTQDL